MDIIPPQAMLKQSYLIVNNYKQLTKGFNKMDGTCSRPTFKGRTKFQRAVLPAIRGKEYKQKKLELRSRFPYILKLDVKNYYRSIYTHSIPWAIHGKTNAKTNKWGSSLGNNLDKAFQQGQDGQTVGIPTGPDTSFIISEVILTRMTEAMIQNKAIKNDRYLRYFDDIEYGCESANEGNNVLGIFEKALREYELEINPEKVEIISGPSDIEYPWIYHLKAHLKGASIKSDSLLEMFSFVADLAKQHPNDYVFRYFLKRMREVIVDDSAWRPYQNILFALLQENHGDIKEVLEQLYYYQYIGKQIDKRMLTEGLNRKVEAQLNTTVTSELSWVIYGYLLFDLQIDVDLARKILKSGDVPSKILISKLAFQKKSILQSDINAIVKSWGKDVLNSEDWLFAYEVFANGWHTSGTRIEMPSNRELFEYLKDNKVSFLDFSALNRIYIPTVFRQEVSKDERPFEDFFAEEDDDDNKIDGVSGFN